MVCRDCRSVGALPFNRHLTDINLVARVIRPYHRDIDAALLAAAIASQAPL
jgi:hypothetical protein